MKKRRILKIALIIFTVGVLITIAIGYMNLFSNKKNNYPDTPTESINEFPEETTKEEAEDLIKKEFGNIQLEFIKEENNWYIYLARFNNQTERRIRFQKYTKEISSTISSSTS